MADAARPHLQDQEPGTGVSAGHGDRDADLPVEGLLGGDRRAQGGEDLRQQVLGAGLPGRAGHPDQARVQAAGELGRDRGGGLQHVGHDDGGHTDRARAEDGGRPGGDGGLCEVMAVAGGDQGEEQATGHGLPGVERQGAGDLGLRVGGVVEGAAGERGDLGKGQGEHGRPFSGRGAGRR